MQHPAGTAPREAGSNVAIPDVLAGVVERVLFERAETGYRVLRVRTSGGLEPVVVVGSLPPAEPGELIRAEGAWYDDPAWGRQFRAQAATIEPPASEAGLIAYLASGRVKGMGEELARRLVEHFRTGRRELIQRGPQGLLEVEGEG